MVPQPTGAETREALIRPMLDIVGNRRTCSLMADSIIASLTRSGLTITSAEVAASDGVTVPRDVAEAGERAMRHMGAILDKSGGHHIWWDWRERMLAALRASNTEGK